MWKAQAVLKVDVDRRFLDHRAHLPETIECYCGYRRGDQQADASTPRPETD